MMSYDNGRNIMGELAAGIGALKRQHRDISDDQLLVTLTQDDYAEIAELSEMRPGQQYLGQPKEVYKDVVWGVEFVRGDKTEVGLRCDMENK